MKYRKKSIEVKENTHFVIKAEDAVNALSEDDFETFDVLLVKIMCYRERIGKSKCPKYYVVNLDEPYADLILEVIKYGEQSNDEFETLKERNKAKTLIVTPIDEGGIIATCPVCKEKYIFNENNLGCEINFCSTCGQAVKLEEQK